MKARPIKFRHYFPSTGKITASHDIMTVILTATGKEDMWRDAVWMQFTGKMTKTGGWETEPDKDAIEIYEGDIVECWTSRFPDHKVRGVVVYNEDAQAFQVCYRSIGGYANDFMHRWHFFEVIGNIHQNKNLL